MSGLLRLCWSMFPTSLPYFGFLGLLVVFLPWPLISVALLIRFVYRVFAPEPKTQHPLEVYLPRLPADVVWQIASHLDSRGDLIRFALASRATYHSANRCLYRHIALEEDPSSNIPWFRRRLYRLNQCLTKENASYVRSLDFSKHTDLDDTLALSIIAKCIDLTDLSLPAIQEPLESRFGRKGMLIKQPVFLSSTLRKPIYAGITSLTWTGPFIPFRGSLQYAGQQSLQLFRNLRSLTLIYRPDAFVEENDAKCANIYQSTAQDAQCLSEDLTCIAISCTMLEEITFPFWETVYSISGRGAFKLFKSLRRVRFLALDGPMKEPDYGRGLLKFITDLNQIGIKVFFDDPWKSHIDILSLIDELDVNSPSARFLPSATFGPIGPPSNPWHGRTDILNRLEWVQLPETDTPDRQWTLRWPITTLSIDEPQFTVPPIFNSVEFQFNTPVQRGDARQFLKWRQYLTDAVQLSNVKHIRIELGRVAAFYLAFPFFMQFEGDRVLTLHVRRLGLSRENRGIWIRRQWRIRRGRAKEIDVRLEDLAKDDIHVHPARLFERIMVNLLFSGERQVEDITCAFYDRYSRS